MNQEPPHKKMHVKFIARIPGRNDLFKWECNGTPIEAKNILEVHRKYAKLKDNH